MPHSTAELYEQVHRIRSHVAHAVMGLTQLPRDAAGTLPGEALHRAALSAAEHACSILDSWLKYLAPVGKT